MSTRPFRDAARSSRFAMVDDVLRSPRDYLPGFVLMPSDAPRDAHR